MKKSDKKIKRKIFAVVILGMFVSIMLVSGAVCADDDWFEIGADIPPVDIQDEIWTLGKVAIGIEGSEIGSLKNTLEVNGNVSIGEGYANVYWAPKNGMIIEGNVGIGTPSPSAKLDVVTVETQGGAATFGGSTNSATGDFAVAMGYSATASGASSVAMGSSTTASGSSSIAMGTGTTASGFYSIAMGHSTTASGFASTAMGRDITAAGDYSFGIGLANPWPSSWTITQDNTMAIMGGNVGIGTVSPGAKLHSLATTEQLRLGYDASNYASFTVASDGALTIQTAGSDEDIEIRSGSFDNAIFIDDSASNVGIGTASPQGALDVVSTTGGLIVPRMTTAQRNALTAVNGMIIYNTDSTPPAFNFYENGAWVVGSGLD